MIKTTITEEQALMGFGTGVDCSQAVFGEFAAQLGLDRDTALKIAAPFGGGMWHGETCGCVVGALMAIGLKYGQGEHPIRKRSKPCWQRKQNLRPPLLPSAAAASAKKFWAMI